MNLYHFNPFYAIEHGLTSLEGRQVKYEACTGMGAIILGALAVVAK
jgi:hypothetical protein